MTMVLDFENFFLSRFIPDGRWKLVEDPWTFSSHGLMTLEAVFYVGILWLSHHQQMAGRYPSWLVLTKYPLSCLTYLNFIY